MVPGRKIVWTVLDNHFSFTSDATEWTGTDIVFEIEKLGDRTGLRFTHVGLVPGYECYDVCHDGWTTYVASLRDLVATGTGQPYAGEARTASEQALMDPVHTMATRGSGGSGELSGTSAQAAKARGCSLHPQKQVQTSRPGESTAPPPPPTGLPPRP